MSHFSRRTTTYRSTRPSICTRLPLYRHAGLGWMTKGPAHYRINSTQVPLKACYPVRGQRTVAHWLPNARDVEEWHSSKGSRHGFTDSCNISNCSDASIDSRLHCKFTRTDVRSEWIPHGTRHAQTRANVHLSVPAADKLHTMLVKNAHRTLNILRTRPYVCQSCLHRTRSLPLAQGQIANARAIQTATQPLPNDDAPFRKALKDATKQKKKDDRVNSKSARKSSKAQDPRLEKWELTVGIEIHAELNTAKKLFSSAATSANATPNSHVALFDTAFPGTQPHFQKETLIPALRAALALNCEIQHKSSFDRKHYFYQDQPAGYQITQYYGKSLAGSSIPHCRSNWVSRTFRQRWPHHFISSRFPGRRLSRRWTRYNWYQASSNGTGYSQDRPTAPVYPPSRFQPCFASSHRNHNASSAPSSCHCSGFGAEDPDNSEDRQCCDSRHGDGRPARRCQCLGQTKGRAVKNQRLLLSRCWRVGPADRDKKLGKREGHRRRHHCRTRPSN